MKITVSLVYAVIVLSGIILIPNAFAENVPDWVKNTAGWWADDQIPDSAFLQGIQFLINEGMMLIPSTEISGSSETQEVPAWIKNNAGWWADDKISEEEFVNAIAYLVKVGIISIESSKSPELIAEMWVNGDINDDEFLANVEHLIEKDVITIQNDSITKTSQLPDWLVNNAGWWAARILTNSDFNFDPGYVKEEIYPCKEASLGLDCFEETYNSHGFRGIEFQKQKHDVDFRIFTVGGSTTYGVGTTADETWPAYLQQIINEEITGKKIEVINAGLGGATTETEYNLIKNKIAALEPDLIIMYDGWNDYRSDAELTVQNWKSVCKLGKNEGFDTVIIAQPITTSGKRVLTEQEIWHSITYLPYLQISQQYIDAFEELDKICTKTIDFRGIFDYVQEPVFWDGGHTMGFANKIIAGNVFSVISSYFGQTYSVWNNNLNFGSSESGTSIVYAVGADLSYRNFDNLNLQNAVFDKADLSNTSFKNTNIDGARFVFANLSSSNLLDRTDLSNVNLAGTDLSNLSLYGKNLSGTILIGVDLSGKDLTGTILIGTDLTNANLTGADLSGNDLTGTILIGTDLTNANLTGVDLSGKDLNRAGTDAEKLTTRTILIGTDLTNANLTGVDLSYKDLTGAKLVGVDLSGKDLTGSGFNHASFEDANLESVNFTSVQLSDVDLTNIKNKSLAGSNLTDATFAESNLSGVNLSEAILFGNNWKYANLSGQDFSVVSNASVLRGMFQGADLSNSNFESINLSPQTGFTTFFKNKADLKNLYHDELMLNLFADSYCEVTNNFVNAACLNVRIIHTKVIGNDLEVDWTFANTFIESNLENANFENAELWFADFRLADLTNANLSGADLRNTFLMSADLSNADLRGANLGGANLGGANLGGADLGGADLGGADLQDTILDNAILTGANLKCVNHPICESGYD
jgi:uncharacterized protein YjbI with pentapeptide repeats